MELIFLAGVLAVLLFTGMWKLVAPIFFLWWLAFIIAEHSHRTVHTAGHHARPAQRLSGAGRHHLFGEFFRHGLAGRHR